MKVDFPFWGILDTADATDQGTNWLWRKEFNGTRQILMVFKDTMQGLQYEENDTKIIPIILRRNATPK